MAKEIVSVEVEKSGYEVMQGLAKFAKAVKAAHAGGANLIEAIPADVAAAVADLAPMIGQLSAIPAEAVEDRAAMLKGAMIGAVDVASAILS